MYQIRWDRLLGVLAILVFPLAYSYLSRHVEIGKFSDSLFAPFVNNPEIKGLVLLAVILLGVVLLLKALRS